jgi:hypothetical protein
MSQPHYWSRRSLIGLGLLGVLAACEDRLNGPTDVQTTHSTTLSIASLSVDDSNPPSDGASLIRVSVALAGMSGLVATSVQLTTTAGQFQANGATAITLLADGTGSVTTFLRVPRDPGKVVIRAVAGAASKSIELTVRRALPQQLLLTALNLGIPAGAKNQLTITASAIRTPGFVSRGLLINFSLQGTPSGGLGTGALDGPAATDSLGNATIHFSPGSASGPDSVWLRASSPSALGPDSLVTLLKLFITPAASSAP